MQEYRKLVRDKIPEIIERQGFNPRFEILSDDKYLLELDKKLNEELAEYQESKKLEELADILEVIYAICKARNYSIDQLFKLKEDKLSNRGGFIEKVFLISKE